MIAKLQIREVEVAYSHGQKYNRLVLWGNDRKIIKGATTTFVQGTVDIDIGIYTLLPNTQVGVDKEVVRELRAQLDKYFRGRAPVTEADIRALLAKLPEVK